MKTSGNTVLITGGATGIGLAMAEAFINSGNRVIICGRRREKLEIAKSRLPQVHTLAYDVTREAERNSLIGQLKNDFPELNVLVNNAGIQRFVDFKTGHYEPADIQQEIDTNLAAPIFLSGLCVPLFLKQKQAAVANVSSGLGFIPIAAMPVYCATKAALHSFTVSLRQQLKNTPIKVFEIIPPTVATELGSTEEAQRGITPAEVARAALEGIGNDNYEIAVGEAAGLVEGARTNFNQLFQRLNDWG